MAENKENPSATGSGILLELIRSSHAWNRRELQQELGWSRTTLAKRLDELLTHGLIRVRGQQDSTGGRPAEEFTLVSDSGIIFSLDLGISSSRVAVADLSGKILIEDEADILISSGPKEVFSWAMQCFDYLLSNIGKTKEEVRAIGINITDPVDPATGVIKCPIMMPSWTGISLRDSVQKYFPEAVVAWERDVTAKALAERKYGWPDSQDLLFVKIGSGLSCGLLLGGQVFRGADGWAGNFGNLLIKTGTSVPVELNEVASGRAIQRDLIRQGRRVRTTGDIVRYSQDGDQLAQNLLRKASATIAESLLDLTMLLNPELLIIGGSIAASGEPVMGPINDYFQAQAQILPGKAPEIVRARLGASSGVIGATILAQNKLFAPDRISALTSPVVL